ncbi:MAG: hypothetical protein Tsb0027_19310 [Wenzhouxiangellaceae bacterium]
MASDRSKKTLLYSLLIVILLFLFVITEYIRFLLRNHIPFNKFSDLENIKSFFITIPGIASVSLLFGISSYYIYLIIMKKFD